MTTVFVHASPCNAVVSQGGATGHSRGCGIAKGSLVAVGVVPGTTVGGLIVAEVHDDGEVLLTSDGLTARGLGWCRHDDYTDSAYYQIVGGLRDGRHGWVHRDPDCRRLTQTG